MSLRAFLKKIPKRFLNYILDVTILGFPFILEVLEASQNCLNPWKNLNEYLYVCLNKKQKKKHRYSCRYKYKSARNKKL